MLFRSVAVVAIVVLAVTLNDDTPGGNPSASTPGVGAKETTPNEGAKETTPNVPGVEDSVFDQEPTETQDPTETQEPVGTTVPDETEESGETTPATAVGSTIPSGPSSTDTGLRDPDADIPENTRPAQTEPQQTEPQQTKPQQTEPQQTEPQQTQPTEPDETNPTQAAEGKSDYELFMDMEPAQQREYMESFESMEAFFDWYNAAKEAYELAHPPIDVGDGVIDLEDLLG